MEDIDAENYLKERKLLIEAQQQSYHQFDKAILTMSSSGLGVSIIFLKDFFMFGQAINYFFLILSWVLFALSITCTLLSFLTSQYAYKKQLEFIADYFLNKNLSVLTQKNKLGQFTETFNVLAALLFILGAISTIWFVSINIT